MITWLALLLILGAVVWLLARAYKAGKTEVKKEESDRDLKAAEKVIESQTGQPSTLSGLRDELRNNGGKL